MMPLARLPRVVVSVGAAALSSLSTEKWTLAIVLLVVLGSPAAPSASGGTIYEYETLAVQQDAYETGLSGGAIWGGKIYLRFDGTPSQATLVASRGQLGAYPYFFPGTQVYGDNWNSEFSPQAQTAWMNVDFTDTQIVIKPGGVLQSTNGFDSFFTISWSSTQQSAAYGTLNPNVFDTVGHITSPDPNAAVIGVRINAVPEPSTCAMALAGLACGGSVVFRRRRAR